MSSATEHIFEVNTPLERRFYPRTAPSALIYVHFGEHNDALLLNVSENGVLVSMPEELNRNLVARLSMNLNGLPKEIQLHARVLWTSEAQKRAGVQFIDLSEHDREQIRKWQALQSGQESREPNHEQSRANPQAHSTAADEVEAPGELPAAAGAPSGPHISGFARPKGHVQERGDLDRDGRSRDARIAPEFQVRQVVRTRRTKTSESALAVGMWVAVPMVIAFGIILLIRSGALPNPLAPSAADRKDMRLATTPGTDLPDLKHPNASQIIPQGTANALSRLSSNRRNTDSERTRLDFSATVKDPADTPSELSRIAGTKEASANAQPSTASIQDSKHADASDSRVDQARAANSTSPPTMVPDSPRTSTTPDHPVDRGVPQAELSATSEPALNPVTPNDSSGSNDAARIPKAAGVSYLARKFRPSLPSTSGAEGEVIEVRPEGHRTSFVTLPGARVLESGPMTLRIQRSVLMQGGLKWWPLHRNKKVALGELLSRVDPQASQMSIPFDAAVTVRASVGEDGHVESVQPLSGPEALVFTVVKAVQEWRYQPTLVDGKPVETQADVEVQFHAAASRIAKP